MIPKSAISLKYEKIHIQEVINIKSSKVDPDWMSENIRSVWGSGFMELFIIKCCGSKDSQSIREIED